MIERRTTVKLTNEVFSQVNNLAQKLGQTRSGVIRTAIVNYLKEWGGI